MQTGWQLPLSLYLMFRPRSSEYGVAVGTEKNKPYRSNLPSIGLIEIHSSNRRPRVFLAGVSPNSTPGSRLEHAGMTDFILREQIIRSRLRESNPLKLNEEFILHKTSARSSLN